MTAPESPKLEACPLGCASGQCKAKADGCASECPILPALPLDVQAPTASPAPEGVADDVARALMFAERFGHSEGNEDDSFFHLQTLADHVQSQSSTMAGLRDLLAEAGEMIDEAITSEDGLDGQKGFDFLKRAALKPVARGE